MASTDRPNVILIVLDTARADAFESYGGAPGSTPTFAQLASSGALHPRAIASCNWTMPSHVSMFSGLLPRTAGLSLLPDGDRSNCAVVMQSHRDRWLPEVLRRSGYRTAGASTNTWVSSSLGFDLGFDEFLNLAGKRVRRMHETDLRSRVHWYSQAFLARVDDGLRATETRMRRWIDEANQPFFWFVNLIECHSPYLPPRPYNDLGPLGRLLAARDARRYQTLEGIWKACATQRPPPARSLSRMRQLYDRSIRMMDDWLARLCEALDSRGMLDDTLLVVTSDHGENFGEGDLFGHAVSLDDRLLSVPLVFRGPGAREANGITSLASLPRLIGDAVGLADHPWTTPADDVAIAQYDLAPRPDDPRLEMIRAWNPTEEGLRRFAYPCTAATDGRYKLVTLGDSERYYDLALDPLESVPADPASAPPLLLAKLREALRRSAAMEWTPDVEALKTSSATAPRLRDDEITDLEERMRLLGYL